MHRRPEIPPEFFLVAIFCILAPTLLACAPKAPPLEAGLPTGYELLEGRETGATSFEIPPTEIDAAEVLPTRLLSGPHHAVRGARIDHGFMYVFDVESEYGRFEVTGTALLRKRAIELEALARLREEQPGMAQLFAYEIANKALEPVEGTLQILRHPVRTTANLPKGVMASVKAAWEMKELGRTHFEDTYMDEFSGLASARRGWAKNMGVDPYTTNPDVQSHLKKNSWVSMMGRSTVMFATMAIPGGAASIALTSIGTTSGINDVLEDIAPEDIRVTTRAWLKNELHVDEETANTFLEHRWYTPTRQQIIIRALGRLDDVMYRNEFIAVASLADEPHETYAFARLALMFAEFDDRVSRIDEFFVTNGLVMAHTVDGGVVLPLYMDHGYWTREVAQSEREIDRFLEWDRDVERKYLLISGEISQRGRRELEARHWDVSEHIEDRWLSQIDIAKYRPPTDAEGHRILPELGR